jgi:hypothetical protein
VSRERSSHGHRLEGAYWQRSRRWADELCALDERVLVEVLDRLTQVDLVDVQGDVRRRDLDGSGDTSPVA